MTIYQYISNDTIRNIIWHHNIPQTYHSISLNGIQIHSVSLSQCRNDTLPSHDQNVSELKTSVTKKPRDRGLQALHLTKLFLCHASISLHACFFLHLVWKVVLARWQGWSEVSLAASSVWSQFPTDHFNKVEKKGGCIAMQCLPNRLMMNCCFEYTS